MLRNVTRDRSVNLGNGLASNSFVKLHSAKQRPRVALVTTHLYGGLGAMTFFLHEALQSTGKFEIEVVGLSLGAFDPLSTHLWQPLSWWRGPQLIRGTWRGEMTCWRAGACLSEFEVQRCRPRRVLNEFFRSCDVIQFVVGTPAIAFVALGIDRPVFIWTATTVERDRDSAIRQQRLAQRWWSRLMLRQLVRMEAHASKTAQRVFALSPYTAQDVEKIRKRGDVLVAPCGVDTNMFHPRREGEGDYILWVGRFSDRRKNVELALRAYKRLLNEGCSLPRFLILGEPASPETLRALEHHGLTANVELVEYKQGEEVARIFREALFLVLSSDEEGLGIVLLEAMASGLPSISTACGGPECVIRNGVTGLLVPVGDEKALAEAMRQLLFDPARRQLMGELARREAGSRFSLELTRRPFLETYDVLACPSVSV